MTLKDFDKEDSGHGWIYTGKTDFNTGRRLMPYSVYIYKKGWFRGHEDKVVVKFHSITTNQDRDKLIYIFESMKEAITFAKQEMEKM